MNLDYILVDIISCRGIQCYFVLFVYTHIHTKIRTCYINRQRQELNGTCTACKYTHERCNKQTHVHVALNTHTWLCSCL